MPEYRVRFIFNDSITINVSADTDDEARETAFEKLDDYYGICNIAMIDDIQELPNG